MTNKEQALIEQYAKSLVEVASEKNCIQSVQSDILAILNVFEHTELSKTLASLAVPREEKATLVRLLQESSSVYLNNFLEVILQNEREVYLQAILRGALVEIGRITNEYDIVVTTAVSLSDEQKTRIRETVARKFDVKAGRLIAKIDQSIIGGFVINVNNKVIDASIRRQLQQVKMNLK